MKEKNKKKNTEHWANEIVNHDNKSPQVLAHKRYIHGMTEKWKFLILCKYVTNEGDRKNRTKKMKIQKILYVICWIKQKTKDG